MHTSCWGGDVDVGVFHFIQGGDTGVVIHKYSKRSFIEYFRIIYENRLFTLVSVT